MNQPIIEVNNLIKRYRKGEKNAVDGISFSVQEGEFFALLGPNGAGKTTTVSILTTSLAKTIGAVTIAGYDLDREPQEVRRHIGVIFQSPSLDLNLTAEENIRFHVMLYHIYPFNPIYRFMPEQYKKRVEELASILDLGNAIFHPVKTFSGGMKRKLEIIRSLMHHPRVLFLDEPTIGLDPLTRKNLWEYLHQMREKERITIFLTTHYLEEAEGADNVCIILRGKIITLGTPYEIKHRLTDAYILLDADNRDLLIHELQTRSLPYTGSPPRIPLNGKKVQEIIKMLDTPLTTIRVHNPTLEEAYLAIIAAHEGT